MTVCPSKRVLEVFFYEGHGPDEVERHVEACPSCRDFLREAAQDRQAFLTRYPFPRLWNALEDRKSRSPSMISRLREWLWPRGAAGVLRNAVALAGVAGLMIFTLWGVWQTQQAPEILTKGGVGLGVYVAETPEKISRGRDGMQVKPGSVLQFVYSTPEAKHLLLVGVEADGTLSVYHPGAEGDRPPSEESAPIAAGTQVQLPQALLWQPHAAYERFFGIFSPKPISVADVRRSVEQIRSQGKTIEETSKLPLPYPQASILLKRR